MKHQIHFCADISPASVSALRDLFLQIVNRREPVEAVTLLISSDGGDVNSGFAAYSTIRALPYPVTAVNISSVESIAVPLFLAADNRLCVPDSRFVLHSLHLNVPAGRIDHARVCEHADSLDNYSQRYRDIVAERTQGAECPLDLTHTREHAFILSATDAKSAGIVSDIVPYAGLIDSTAVQWWVDAINR